jgi:ribosomal protein S18 acetylase RimI-like enzyme
MNLILRQAIETDIEFIIETIIEAEKSHTDKLSYSSIFSLTIEEVKSHLKNILLLDFPGQELCYSQYLIAEFDNSIAGACCAWIEAEDDLESAVIKGNLLLTELGGERITSAKKYFPMLHQINIEREPATLQIVNAYVKPEFRGKGIIGKLILQHIDNYSKKNPNLKKVQLRPIKTNPQACRAYEKIGFQFVLEKTIDDKSALDILPSDTKILMEKIL